MISTASKQPAHSPNQNTTPHTPQLTRPNHAPHAPRRIVDTLHKAVLEGRTHYGFDWGIYVGQFYNANPWFERAISLTERLFGSDRDATILRCVDLFMTKPKLALF